MNIEFDEQGGDMIMIKHHLLDSTHGETENRIETLKFTNGDTINISNLEFIDYNNTLNEDSSFIISIANLDQNTTIYNNENWTTKVTETGIKFTPQENQNGQFNNQFLINNGANLQVVNYDINIMPINDAPEQIINQLKSKDGKEVEINLDEAFKDIDGDTLSYSLVTDSELGHSEILNTSFLKYKPDIDSVGTDLITINVFDGIDTFEYQLEVAITNNNIGRDRNDYIKGKTGSDTLIGGLGNDTLDGGGGTSKDDLYGGAGNDTLIYRADQIVHIKNAKWFTKDLFDGGDGYDVITMSGKDESLTINERGHGAGIKSIEEIRAGGGDDYISLQSDKYNYDTNVHIKGGDGNDQIYSGSGNDTLNGGQGTDQLFGGAGDDLFIFSREKLQEQEMPKWYTKDSYDGGEDYDILKMSDWNEFLDIDQSGHQAAIKGIEEIRAGGGNDRIELMSDKFVYETDVILKGEAGNDYLMAGKGNDTLEGGEGDDELHGGSGSDMFVFQKLSHSVRDSMDFIADFEQGIDKIDLRRLTSIEKLSDLQFGEGYNTTIIEDKNSSFAFELLGDYQLVEDDFMFAFRLAVETDDFATA